MDAKQVMVIDTSRKGSRNMFITSSVARLDYAEGMWRITFNTSAKTYSYRRERIKYLKNPVRLDVAARGVYVRKRRIGEIRELYKFTDNGRHDYYHAVCENGTEVDFDGRHVYVSRTKLDECGGDTWKYLNHLAEETGLEMDGVGNILKMQYDRVDRDRDNVPLAPYVGDKRELRTCSLPETVLYPFGCNASQKKGVENALTHQVSIIQGPPGTGKTQTILNIIANLLLSGKTVLVVSNNNSAVENVAEKLSGEEVGLGFLVAQLGNSKNKEAFIANQPPMPDMQGWVLEDAQGVREQARKSLEVVAGGFERQTELARLRIELDALATEARYDALQRQEDVPWVKKLCSCPSRKLLALKEEYERLYEAGKSPGKWFRLKWVCRLGRNVWPLLGQPATEVVSTVETAYLAARLREVKQGIKACEDYLASIDMGQGVKDLRSFSLQMLRHEVARFRAGSERKVFETVGEIKFRSEEFLQEYPVVLSTTYAAKNCISKDLVFDYVIMDEASQVDITTGALALSCALNAVVVGDDKQLPNVVDDKTRMALGVMEEAYGVEDKYRSSVYSFLQSCCMVFADAPQTLLREHYRCHPKIIEFCNQKFYDGQLVTMTEDRGEEHVLQVIRTVKGQHARGHSNQREIDVIRTEVVPQLAEGETVGIITPYRDQAHEINKQLGTGVASTVHKYQGRECGRIILSMVDNQPTAFSDDPNLLNVAISRAKDGLVVVASGNELDGQSNLAQLIAYVLYHNFEVVESKVHSVFDLLYKQYTQERLAFASAHEDLGECSEAIAYQTIQEAIGQMGLKNCDVLCHYPLSRLLAADVSLTGEEWDFAKNTLSHVDFLVYNSLTKRPLLAIEVDGWSFHQTDVQQKRDKMKDRILAQIGLSVLRVSTVQVFTTETIKQGLQPLV